MKIKNITLFVFLACSTISFFPIDVSASTYCTGGSTSNWGSPIYPNGQAVKDSFSRFYYPDGSPIVQGSDIKWPTGQVVRSFGEIFYPTGQKLQSFGKVFYPDGKVAKDNLRCWAPSGLAVACNGVAKIHTQSGFWNSWGYWVESIRYSGLLELGPEKLRSLWAVTYVYDGYDLNFNLDVNQGSISSVVAICH